MRLLIPILEACILLTGAARAQNSGDSSGSGAPQLPVGQVFKQFVFPSYQDGVLKYTLFATEAKGITLNRAETTDLKIDVYDNGAVTTTITSPKADLIVAEQKMRTKNTVQIERDDMRATSQNCEFNVKDKKFVMTTNVRVLLKHFDLSAGPSGAAPKSATPSSKPATDSVPSSAAAPAVPAAPATPPAHSTDSLLTSPGSYADTNSAPLPPSNPVNK
jgi:hypothetical protein